MLSRPKKPVSTTRRSARVHGRRISVRRAIVRAQAAGPHAVDDLRRVDHAAVPWVRRRRRAPARRRPRRDAEDRRGHRSPRRLRHDAGDDDAVPDRSPRAGRRNCNPERRSTRTSNTTTEPWTLSNVTSSSGAAAHDETLAAAPGDAAEDRRRRARHAVHRPDRASRSASRSCAARTSCSSFIYTRCAGRADVPADQRASSRSCSSWPARARCIWSRSRSTRRTTVRRCSRATRTRSAPIRGAGAWSSAMPSRRSTSPRSFTSRRSPTRTSASSTPRTRC